MVPIISQRTYAENQTYSAKLIYDADGGLIEGEEVYDGPSVGVETNDETYVDVPIIPTIPERQGYEFAFWVMKDEYEVMEEVYNSEMNISATKYGVSPDKEKHVYNMLATSAGNEETLTAVWAKKYKVTYDSNEGSPSIKAVEGNFGVDLATAETKTDDVTIKVAEAVSREGYIFEGWKGASGTLYQPGDNFTVKFDNPNVKLTASWKKKMKNTFWVERGTQIDLKDHLVAEEYGEGYDTLDVKGKKYVKVDVKEDPAHDTITYIYEAKQADVVKKTTFWREKATNKDLRNPLVGDEYGRSEDQIEFEGKKYNKIDTVSDAEHNTTTYFYELEKDKPVQKTTFWVDSDTNDYLRKPLVGDEYGEAYPSLEVNGKKYLRIDTLNDDTHHSITHVYKLDKSNDSALDENKPKNENKDKDENKPKGENKDKIKPDIDDRKEGINNTDKSKSLDTANSSEVIKTETEDSSLIDSSKVKSPKTGDSKTLLTFITVLVISCIALVLLLVRKKLQK